MKIISFELKIDWILLPPPPPPPPLSVLPTLQIHTVRNRRIGELFIDGESVASGESPTSARLLSTDTPFYWGGVPETLVVNTNDVDVSLKENLPPNSREIYI